MPIFAYKAIDAKGRSKRGTIDADTARDARDKLRRQELRVTTMDQVDTARGRKPGEGGPLIDSGATRLGGRIPVNPSGGLSCFGEAVPAQAIAQVCELTWQLRGQADGRQVEGAKVGVTVNQGLFGHGSSVIVKH